MAMDLLQRLLELNPDKRISAKEALQHPYFKVAPFPCRPEDLPKIQTDTHEYQVKIQKANKKLKQAAVPYDPYKHTMMVPESMVARKPFGNKTPMKRLLPQQAYSSVMEPANKVKQQAFHYE